MRFENKLRNYDAMVVSRDLGKIIFIQRPSEIILEEIRSQGYVEITNTNEGKELMDCYYRSKKHGLDAHRVFIKRLVP